MATYQKWMSATSSEDRTVDVAVLTLTERLDAVPHYLYLSASSAEDDPEYVHQLRVWSRRASVAIQLYEDLLPKKHVRELLKQLKLIRRSANDARDLDVLEMRFAEDPDPRAARLLDNIRSQREQAQEPIVAIAGHLCSEGEFDRLVSDMLWKMNRPEKLGKHKPGRFGKWAGKAVRPVVKRFFKTARADLSELARLHRFRIRGKELRYALELLAGPFSRSLQKKLYPMIVGLQERLGKINDHAAAEDRFTRLLEHTDDPDSIAYLNVLVKNERALCKKHHEEFIAWWTPKRRKRLRNRFRKLKIRRTKQTESGLPVSLEE